MKILLHNAILFLGFCLVFIANGHAQGGCDSILIGIHQHEFVSSQSSKLRTTLDILQRYEVSSYEQARNTGASAGLSLPIDGIPVGFRLGYKADSNNKGNWASKLQTYFSTHNEESQKYIQQIETANKGVVDAWEKCVNGKTGVRVWAEQQSSLGEFVILIQYRPTTKDDAVVGEIDFGSQFEALAGKETYAGKTLAFDGTATIIRAKRREGANEQGQIIVHASINGSPHDTYVNLLPFPTVIDAPIPERPRVDFDGDRLADTYGFVGTNPYSIEVSLGNGDVVRTNLPQGYDPYLPVTQFVTGDFNGDGFTDLVAIVDGGTDKAHVHLSRGDGSFYDNKEFYFKPVANAQHDYSVIGTWSSKYCPKLRRSVLHHMPAPGAHDPNVTGGYFWTPAENGTAFSLSAADPCP